MNYVDHNIALELKKLNFHERVSTYYEDGKVGMYHYPLGWDCNNSFLTFVSRPTITDTLDWLEKTYDVAYEILVDRTTQPKYMFNVYKYEYFGNYDLIQDPDWFLYRTQSETREYCIKFIINCINTGLIKLKSKPE